MQNYVANESHEVCCTCFVGKVANHEKFELLKQYLRLDTEILLDGCIKNEFFFRLKIYKIYVTP